MCASVPSMCIKSRQVVARSSSLNQESSDRLYCTHLQPFTSGKLPQFVSKTVNLKDTLKVFTDGYGVIVEVSLSVNEHSQQTTTYAPSQ